ncbi:hypothetical protein [Microbacterium sp. CH-015]|uniref:hypothetical protein n=1 Tax=Microbacterium sp. CH-015 TaxID=3406734 RepID=UPI003C71BFDA
MGVQTMFSSLITRAVKAELARRGEDGLALIAPLSLSRNSVYARLREEKPFSTDEIAQIADFLGIAPEDLVASAMPAQKKPAA